MSITNNNFLLTARIASRKMNLAGDEKTKPQTIHVTIRSVPRELKDSFKITAIKRGMSMRELLIRVMQEEVDQARSEGLIT